MKNQILKLENTPLRDVLYNRDIGELDIKALVAPDSESSACNFYNIVMLERVSGLDEIPLLESGERGPQISREVPSGIFHP